MKLISEIIIIDDVDDESEKIHSVIQVESVTQDLSENEEFSYTDKRRYVIEIESNSKRQSDDESLSHKQLDADIESDSTTQVFEDEVSEIDLADEQLHLDDPPHRSRLLLRFGLLMCDETPSARSLFLKQLQTPMSCMRLVEASGSAGIAYALAQWQPPLALLDRKSSLRPEPRTLEEYLPNNSRYH